MFPNAFAQGSPACAAEAHTAARSATVVRTRAGHARGHLFADFLLAGDRRLRHVVALRGRPAHWAAPPSPFPDPSSYTTDMGTPGFAGELTTRHFNLTHEWGMELIYYLVLSRTDFQGCLVPQLSADLLFAG